MFSPIAYSPQEERLPRVALSDFVVEDKAPLKSGGLGNVYRVRAGTSLGNNFYRGTPYLIKVLRGKFSEYEKASYFENIERVWRLLGPNRHHFASRIALPLAIVQNERNQPVGFVMKEYKNGCVAKLHGLAGPFEALQELKLFMNSPSERAIFGTPRLERFESLALVGDFLDTLGKIHTRGITVGDISHSNVILHRDESKMRAIFLDFDSFGLLDAPHPLGIQTSLLYTSPEERTPGFSAATHASDTYKAVLLAVRLLSQQTGYSENSFSLSDLTECRALIREFGGDSMTRLLERALGENPEMRPTAALIGKLWGEELTYAEESEIQPH